jgi:hypothetical protein
LPGQIATTNDVTGACCHDARLLWADPGSRIPNLLIAAVAEREQVTVLHCDSD